MSAPDSTLAPRKIYRYSVVPGGVYSADELSRARRLDSVVRAHYADFGEAVVKRVIPTDLYVYVSYRRADRVFWTKGKHRIPKGETVLTDGKHLARARCGNRLSSLPQQPTLSNDQPIEETLNTIEAPQSALLETPQAPLFTPEYDFAPPPLDAETPKAGSAPSPTPTLANGLGAFASPFPMIPGLAPGGGALPILTRGNGATNSSSGTDGAPAAIPVTGPAPPAAVVAIAIPEPSGHCLFLIAAIGLLIPAIHRVLKRN